MRGRSHGGQSTYTGLGEGRTGLGRTGDRAPTRGRSHGGHSTVPAWGLPFCNQSGPLARRVVGDRALIPASNQKPVSWLGPGSFSSNCKQIHGLFPWRTGWLGAEHESQFAIKARESGSLVVFSRRAIGWARSSCGRICNQGPRCLPRGWMIGWGKEHVTGLLVAVLQSKPVTGAWPRGAPTESERLGTEHLSQYAIKGR